jgi:hypothetical protein
MAEFFGEALNELRGHEADLSGPSIGVRGHRQLAVLEAVRPGVAGQLRAHDQRPVTENRADGRPLPPTAGRQQPADGGVERLRIVPAWACRPSRRLRACGSSSTTYNIRIVILISLARAAV